MVINIICRVLFSEHYFKDHIGNKCNITHCIACLSCIVVILLNKFNQPKLAMREPTDSFEQSWYWCAVILSAAPRQDARRM